MRLLSLFTLIIVVGCGGHAEAAVEEFSLDNGMKVIMQPAPRASHAAMVVLFDIGGDHDPSEQSGLAHLVEHVYVSSATGRTKSRTVQEYMKAYPLGWNAQTGDKYTVIATVFAADALDAELQDAADRMGDLRVADSDLERELPRMQSELHNMYSGIPQLAASNLARERIRPSALGSRRGGVIEQVLKLTVEDVEDRWRKYYKPKNVTLVLAGRFDPVSAKQMIQDRFSSIEPGEQPPELPERAPANLAGPLRISIKPDQRKSKPRVCLTFAAPAPADDLFAPFLVLVAKMQTRATELQTDPTQFPVQFMALDDPGVLYVAAEVPDGETAEKTIERLDAFVLKIADERFGKNDVKTTKDVFGFSYGMTALPAFVQGNLYGVAFSLGRREQLGIDPKQLANSIHKVSQEDVERCRKEIFESKHRAAIIVAPE